MLSNTARALPAQPRASKAGYLLFPGWVSRTPPTPGPLVPETFLPTSRVCYFPLPPSGRVGKTPTHPTGSQHPEIKLTQNLIGEHEFETENAEQI